MPSYIYSALDSATPNIRILKLLPGTFDDEIACQMSHVPLSASPLYEALSYTWGDANTNPRSIRIDSCSLEVASNLHDALQRLRSEETERTMWIDAICINQKDLDEKAQQVSLMKSIYSSAQNVVIWLGQEKGTTALAMKWLRGLSAFYKWAWRGGPAEDPIETALAEFFTHLWWGRVWIVQELVFARHASFVCGKQHIELEDFEDEFWASVKILEEESDDHTLPPYLSGVLSLLQTRGLIRVGEAGGCPFPLVLQKHLYREGSCPQDYIYAFLGLSETIGIPDIIISYHFSVRQAYAHFVKRWIKRYSNLDVITNNIESLDRGLTLPSWVPDWSGKQRCPRWDVGTSNTWGRNGGFSTWTVGPFGPEDYPTTWRTAGHPEWNIDMAATEDNEMRVIEKSRYSTFLTLDGVTVDEMAEVESKSCRPYKTYKDLFHAWEPKDIDSGVYSTGESKVSAFLSTLLSGRYTNDHLITIEEVTKLVDDYQVYMNRKKHPPSSEEYNSNETFFNSTLKLLLLKLHRRTFAVTKSGYYAMVPENTQVGDRLVALVGGNVPFVLRRVKHDVSSVTPKRDSKQHTGPPALEGTEPSPPFSALTAPNQYPSTPIEEEEINGPAYSGTSRGPKYPLIYNQQLIEGQENNTDESVGVRILSEFFIPRKVPGGSSSKAYDPTFEIVGTAYVHGFMSGEVKGAYEQGRASLQTFLLV